MTKTLSQLKATLKMPSADEYVYYKTVENKRIFLDIRGCNKHYVDLEVVDIANAKTILKKRVKFLNIAGLKNTLNKIYLEEIYAKNHNNK